MQQIMKRTCSNCCSYDQKGGCMNGISGPVSPGDRCKDHETQEEFDADVRAIRLFRKRLGLPPQEPFSGLGEDEGDR